MGRPAVLKVDIVGDARGLSRATDDAESRLDRIGRTAGRLGKAVGAGLAVAGLAVGAFAVGSVKSASEVEQSFGAVDSVFGKSAGSVKRWAGQAATSVGLAKSEYAGLATVVGSQLQNMGRSQAEAATQTKGLIGMGADLAATFGGSVSDAVGAVSSLLKGERDPIERYGVSIKQADIDARLAAQGLDGLTGKAKAQAEATATLELLTKQTSAAHGAFSRESGTLAGQQERLKAQFENVKASIGEKLLPVATKLFTWFSEKLLPGASKLSGELGERLGPFVNRVGGFISENLVPAGRKLYGWIVEDIVPAVRTFYSKYLSGLLDGFQSVKGSIDGNSDNLKKLGNFLGTVIPPLAKTLATILGTTLGTAFRVLGEVIGGVITAVSKLVGWIDSAIGKWNALKDKVGGGLGKVGSLIGLGGVPLLGAVPGQLVGRVGSLRPAIGGFATAAAGDGGLSYGGTGRPAADLAVVDRRTIRVDVRIDGDVLDGDGLVRKLQRAGDELAVRLGRATTFGTAPA